MTKIYTKTGDKGETGLFSGERVSKADPLVNAYGTVDELNSVLGVALSLHPNQDRLAELITALQRQLLDLGADMGSGEMKAQRTSDARVSELEGIIDELTAQLTPLTQFILPGGHPVAAQLHHARTVCRRAERAAIAATDQRPLDQVLVRYLNRLADLLFTLARYANHIYDQPDVPWKTD
jgi:cob(I)alamin adenosyltransferase